MSTRNKERNTRTESNNAAKQQVNNLHTAPATQAQDAPVPANVEDVERRCNEAAEALKKAKKQQRKASDNVANLRDRVANESYALATLRTNMGTADENDAVILANRKAENSLTDTLVRAMDAMPQDSDEVAKLRASVKAEERSLTSAIAETKRQWGAAYKALYATIGITKQAQLTPALLKDLSPFLLVGTADGLKAAQLSRYAVRKNGKAVKVNGKRVYRYTLRERKGWSAYALFETLELNFRWAEKNVFSEDELITRRSLIDAQVHALKALASAKQAAKSNIAEQAHDGQARETALAKAAKEVAKAVKQNTTDAVGSKIA